MTSDQHNSGKELFRGVLLTQVVLLFHVVLLALIGLLVLFLGKVSIYFIWILLGGALLTALSAYPLYRRIKSRGRRALQEMMHGVSGYHEPGNQRE